MKLHPYLAAPLAALLLSAASAAEPGAGATVASARAVADVCAYGAKLDGTTDDAEALRQAFRAVGPTGKIHVPAGGLLRLASTVTMNLGGNRGFSLVCESPVMAVPGIGNAIEIVNGFPKFIDVVFQGGGRLADYRQADPEGADQGLYLRGIRGGEIKVKASGYKGRVIRVTKEQPGEPKSSMLYFSNIETGDHKDPCGQAWYMDGYSAFGMIGRAWVFWDKNGPIFNGLHDLTINDIEGGWQRGTNGLRFEGCSAVHIGKLALGDETQTVVAGSWIIGIRMRCVRGISGGPCTSFGSSRGSRSRSLSQVLPRLDRPRQSGDENEGGRNPPGFNCTSWSKPSTSRPTGV